MYFSYSAEVLAIKRPAEPGIFQLRILKRALYGHGEVNEKVHYKMLKKRKVPTLLTGPFFFY